MSGRSGRSVHARLAARALAVLGLAATAGCGQSGPLTLPGKQAKAAGAPAAQQTQSGAKKKDKDKSDSGTNGR